MSYFPKTQFIKKSLNLIAASNKGLVKQENQDFFDISIAHNCIIMAIADGVSASHDAKKAAQKAIKTAIKYIQNNPLFLNYPDKLLKEAIKQSHMEVTKLSLKNIYPLHLEPPETTITLCLIKDNIAYIAWVGDSRAYSISNNKIIALTVDDSLINYAKKHNISTYNLNPHAITQCLGMPTDLTPLDIHVTSCDMACLDYLLLSTDGFHNYIDFNLFLTYLNSTSLESSIKKSIYFINHTKSGLDNISICLYKVDKSLKIT